MPPVTVLPMEILGYIASICIGLILGLLGGGGSILSIPILVYFFQVDAVTASAYSLFIVGVTSLIGAIPKYKDHLVDLRTGIIFGMPSIAAIFATRKWIVPSIPETILQVGTFTFSRRLLLLGLFALLMIVAAWSIISEKKRKPADEHEWKIALLALEGMIIGFLTGLVGAGGGFLIIPALVWLTGLPFKTAVGTSLFIIAINSLLGFMGDVLNYQMDWPFLLSLTGLAISGIVAGHRLHRKIAADRLRKAFGWLTLFMGIFMLLRELFVSMSIM